MIPKEPRVSIGLPVHNGENYLEEALESILSQTFTDFELIISDNASTDCTPEICQKYKDLDSRIRYYRSGVNRGAAWNFNHVFELARGKYFKWAAHDDLIDARFLERCVSVLENDPGIVLCFSGVRIIDARNQCIEEFDLQLDTNLPEAHQRFRELVLIWHGCLDIFGLIRTDALRKTARIGSYSAADRVLLAELALLGRFYRVPEYLFTLRIHPGQSTQSHILAGTNRINRHTYMVWFDSSSAGRLVFPQWQLLFGYQKSILQKNLNISTKLHCQYYLARWSLMCGRSLIADLLISARQILQLKLPGAGRSKHAVS